MRTALVLILLLAGCHSHPAAAQRVATTPASSSAYAAAVEEARAAVASAGVPAVVTLREAVESTLPVPAIQPAQAPAGLSLSEAGLAHIVRWEVTSEARYTRALRWPVWPGGASGITWCIGYDGGHQTARDIRADWHAHPQRDRLAKTSGIVGAQARTDLPSFRDIATPFQPCVNVFLQTSVPVYMRAAERAYGRQLRDQPQGVIDALFGNAYNRGGSMLGERNREKRVIRDACLPARDAECVAAQLRAQKRLWPDVPGLQDRRESEAQLALVVDR